MVSLGNKSGPGSSRQTPIYKDWTVLQLAALVLLLDQFTKYLVIELIPYRWSFPSEGFFRFTHVHNTGSAFGILQGLNTPLIFVSFVGVIILVLIYRSQTRPSNWLRLSLGLQLGGALGNLIDRLRLGYVTDFIDIGPWPVFNLADASIVTGLVLLAWIFLRSGQDRKPAPAPHVAGSTAHQGGSGWCPICDGDMVEAPGGWRCLWCGVKERVDRSGIVASLDKQSTDGRFSEGDWNEAKDDVKPVPHRLGEEEADIRPSEGQRSDLPLPIARDQEPGLRHNDSSHDR